ncbi:MAG: histidine phosphatase family protein [Clostridia bacterium]|nr:histidine phosphatase family protein [Clostridia bacterium]
MTRLILLRHGQSEANLKTWFAGHSDPHLTELGLEQAQRAADYLAANEHIDLILASDLYRATETALPTARLLGLPVHPTPGFREIYAGVWEGMRFSDLIAAYPDGMKTWIHDLANARPAEGESVAELFVRVTAALDRVARENDGKTVLIATHWTPIRAMICHAMRQDHTHISDYPKPFNASIHILGYDKGTYTIEQMNVVEHLNGLLPKSITE